MDKVLIPTDFSSNAEHAAQYAFKLFGQETDYVLVNSFEVPHSGATMLISIADILEKDSNQLLEKEKARLVGLFPKMKDRIHVRAVMGIPSLAIKKAVQLEEADVVVMGTKGATGLKGILLGSVAANTMSELKCPVIAVPQNAELTAPKKILFAADDQCLVEGKLPAGMDQMANRWKAEVMILNVVPSGEGGHAGNKKGLDRSPIGVFENVKHSFHFVESDDVNKGIQIFMNRNKVDLLAMITRKNDLVSNLFGLSNAKNMMQQAEVPLAVFH